MDRTQKITIASLAGLAVAIALLKWRNHPSVAVPPAGVDPFMAPYEYQTPGISDDTVTLNGGAPFQSTVNVTVNPSYLGTLSQNYIPLFGFVGSGAGAPSSSQNVSAPTRIVAPPPAPTYFATPTPPPISPPVYQQPAPFASHKTPPRRILTY